MSPTYQHRKKLDIFQNVSLSTLVDIAWYYPWVFQAFIPRGNIYLINSILFLTCPLQNIALYYPQIVHASVHRGSLQAMNMSCFQTVIVKEGRMGKWSKAPLPGQGAFRARVQCHLRASSFSR